MIDTDKIVNKINSERVRVQRNLVGMLVDSMFAKEHNTQELEKRIEKYMQRGEKNEKR